MSAEPRFTLQMNLTAAQAAQLLGHSHAENLRQLSRVGVESRWDVCRRIKDGSLRYVGEDPSELWRFRDATLEDGIGDCEDIAPAVSAEYAIHGFKARPACYPTSIAYHVIVELLFDGPKQIPGFLRNLRWYRSQEGVIVPLDPCRTAGMP